VLAANATGTHSVYTTWEDYEVMFHVSTYLPYDDKNRQQLERKRHLGNDIVVLIFSDGNTPYLANAIKSEFNRTASCPLGHRFQLPTSSSFAFHNSADVFIVVQPVKLPSGAVAYRYGIAEARVVRTRSDLLRVSRGGAAEWAPRTRRE
jgi:hypothetical protein